jgi:hypothetical protein
MKNHNEGSGAMPDKPETTGPSQVDTALGELTQWAQRQGKNPITGQALAAVLARVKTQLADGTLGQPKKEFDA